MWATGWRRSWTRCEAGGHAPPPARRAGYAGADNLLELGAARQLGERAGLPPPRLAASRTEQDALVALQMPPLPEPTAPPTVLCLGLARQMVLARRSAEIGELPALREVLKSRPK